MVLIDDHQAVEKYEETIMLWVVPDLIKTPEGLAVLKLIWKEIVASGEEKEDDEDACRGCVEWKTMNGIEDETAGWLFRENLPFRWKGISQPRPGSGEANMIGFGLETWWSTVPEDDGERIVCGEENNGQKKRARVCVCVCVCWRSLVAEAVVTSFAVRTGTNPLVLIWLCDSAWLHWKCQQWFQSMPCSSGSFSPVNLHSESPSLNAVPQCSSTVLSFGFWGNSGNWGAQSQLKTTSVLPDKNRYYVASVIWKCNIMLTIASIFNIQWVRVRFRVRASYTKRDPRAIVHGNESDSIH